MKKLRVFYIFVLITSFLTINNNLNDLLSPVNFISLIGIVSAVLFFVKKMSFYFLTILWIVAQIPYLVVGEQVIDFSQFLNFHFYLTFGSVSLGLNAQVFLLFFLKPILLSELLFQNVTFKAYSENEKLKRENEYSFIPIDIIDGKLVGNPDIEIENEIYSKITLKPVKSERVKKAGVTLVSSNEVRKIKGLVEYRLSNEV